MEQVNNNCQETNAVTEIQPIQGKKRIIMIAIAAVVIAAVIVAAILIIKWNGPESVAERYLRGFVGDTSCKDAYNLLAYDWRELMMEQADCESEEELLEYFNSESDEEFESFNDIYRYQDEGIREYLEEEYGLYKMDVKVINTKDTSIKKALNEELYGLFLYASDKIYDLDEDDISACKKVRLRVKIEGEEKTHTEKMNVYVVKINGAWKVLGNVEGF